METEQQAVGDEGDEDFSVGHRHVETVELVLILAAMPIYLSPP
jgi:hypothetical protein